MGMFAWLLRNAVSPADEQDEVDRKRMFLSASASLGAAAVLLVIAAFLGGKAHTNEAHMSGLWSFLLVNSGLLVVLFSRKAAARPLTTVFILSAALTLICLDWNMSSSLINRPWTAIVILLDLALVVDLDERVTRVVIGITLLWLTVERAEHGFRFGLYDVMQELGQREVAICDCGDPPCSAGGAAVVGGLLLYFSVFLLDFHFTRGFAVRSRQQMELLSASVGACNTLTGHIARYEVEAARAVVDGESGDRLPPELRESYARLLQNLDSYRPYLPDSLLLPGERAEDESEWDQRSEQCSLAAAPGEGLSEATACILFTDIQSSTALWEAHHQGMYDALLLHNSLLRRLAGVHGGYEVKTIGDAFMLAFRDAAAAVMFALAAQHGLAAAEWPADLLRAPLCCRVESSSGDVLWNGLRVRIGMHCGVVRVEQNPVTHRCDYFGPPVNIAARVESELKHGGLIGITQDVKQEIHGLDCLGNPEVKVLGLRSLKGVAQPVEISVVLARQFVERWQVVGKEAPKTDLSVVSLLRQSSNQSSSEASFSANFLRPDVNTANSRLNLALTQTSASCATVRLTLSELQPLGARVNLSLTVIEHAVDVTHGVIQAVLSGTCVVTWNTGRACYAHGTQCAHFTSVLCNRADTYGLHTRTGAAGGRVLSGNLAGMRRRFATVIGSCVELAATLAEVAELLHVRTVAVGSIVHHCASCTWLGEMRSVRGEPVVLWVAQAEPQAPRGSTHWPISPGVRQRQPLSPGSPWNVSLEEVLSRPLPPLWGADCGSCPTVLTHFSKSDSDFVHSTLSPSERATPILDPVPGSFPRASTRKAVGETLDEEST